MSQSLHKNLKSANEYGEASHKSQSWFSTYLAGILTWPTSPEWNKTGGKAEGGDKARAVLLGEEARASSLIYLRGREGTADQLWTLNMSINNSICKVHQWQQLQSCSSLTARIELYNQESKAVVQSLKTLLGSCIRTRRWAKVMADSMGLPTWPRAHCSSPGSLFPGLFSPVWVLQDRTAYRAQHRGRSWACRYDTNTNAQGMMKASRVQSSSMTLLLPKLAGKRDYHYSLLPRLLMMILLLSDWRITERCM